MQPIIRVENLSKQYMIGARQNQFVTLRDSLADFIKTPLNILRRGERNAQNVFWALRDVNFEVMPGEVLGIIGRNGAGKSTLLKILSGITESTKGRVELYGRIGSLLEVGTGFHPELTGRENIFLNGTILGMKRREIAAKFDEIVDFAEVGDFIDTPVKHYSSGMYLRLAFAVAAHLESDILVVDEVLAVGDAKFQKKCIGEINDLAKNGRTVIFVSHDMSIVHQLCSRALLLTQGMIESSGNVDQVIEGYLHYEKQVSEKIFDGEQVKWAAVRQIDEQIEILVDYQCTEEITFPSLGFVVHDYAGNAILGRNLMADADTVSLKSFDRKTGRVGVRFSSPILVDGTYRLSLWFGDGVEDLFEAPYCLVFDVVKMTFKKPLPPSIHGSVIPECEWKVE